jgi:hypothetical protein
LKKILRHKLHFYQGAKLSNKPPQQTILACLMFKISNNNKMRKTTTTLSLGFLAAGMLFTQTAITNSSGVSAPLSGSPLSSGTCANCHSGGTLTTQDVMITTDIPVDGFEENTDYTITVKGMGNGATAVKGGFNATVEDGSSFVGTLSTISGGGAQVGGSAATHTSSNNTFAGDTLVYQFKWNSGSASSATIYTAFNFANGNGVTSGDAIKTKTLVLTKNTIGLEELAISTLRAYPNPVAERLNVEFAVPRAADLHISMTDLSGKYTRELFNGRAAVGPFTLSEDIHDLPEGLYILSIQYDNDVYHDKVIKR